MSVLRSLRFRLLLGGALWIAVALVASWIFIFASFASLIEADRRADLAASLGRIVAELDPESTVPLAEGPLSDPRYDTPLSGVYWQVEDLDQGGLVRSRSLWDIELPAGRIGEGRATMSQLDVPDRPTLIVLTQTITMQRTAGTARHFQVSVAEERSAEDDPIVRFGTTLALFLAILAIALFIAAIVQIYVGLKPLGTLQRGISAVRSGAAEKLPDTTTLELQPVTAQINDLLEAQEATIGFVRERAGDLAHGLKTPLAVLGATADRLRAQGDIGNADTLQLLTEQMNERIDYQLRIARLRFRTRAQGVSSSINDAVLRSVAVLRKGHRGERIKWVVNLEDRLEVDIDRHDLMELVGIVLENAEHWARGTIAIRAMRSGNGLVDLMVEDDGEGLTDQQIAQLGQRGVRLDERSAGHGMGIAIGLEILRLNRGTMQFGRSKLGGLALTLRFVAKGGAPEGAPALQA
ncbi:MAG: HAMP domain-containing histidine kinase [Hyphomicrobiales bacterium]|nr:MAG: HAMP domain-containing histidine kinase [Hyphomicrobiales bacterium]